ncbi:Uncharacterized protein Fot_21346 [Forsythia ovata]|uniref:Transposase (putative) gypsy type domain-containing protein n=1 Tax=Forsythia ovata TaxID=205694 RepID=A0ABD1UUJ8_9LAMI
MTARLTAEDVADLQKQIEESMRQQKGKGVDGPSESEESGGNRESVSPRTHAVNLGLTPDEIDLVEGWVEYDRELSRGHEDPKVGLEDWACSEYPSELSIPDFTRLRDQYRILDSVRLIDPNKTDRPCFPAEGYVAIMNDALACGMRLPYHRFFRAILRSYNLYPYQLSPNFLTHAVGTWLMWQEVSLDYPMPLYVFHTLFKLNKCARRDEEPREGVKDWYYLNSRGTHSPLLPTILHLSDIGGANGYGPLGTGKAFIPIQSLRLLFLRLSLSSIAVDTLGSSSLPKIGLAGLAAKKIPPVAKKKSSDNYKKRILARLSLKDREKDKDAPPAFSDQR